MKILIPYLAVAILAMNALGEGEDFKPTSQDDLDAFYSTPERSVSVTVEREENGLTISPSLLGINLSYFNTTDQDWQQFKLREKLKKAGVSAMRYPGGEETSFFHWREPGVNGYEDSWDDPKTHGNSKGRGRFQTTWLPPEKWATNTDFMNFDEFMAECIAIGAEPVVGINLSSGRKHNRQADGIKEALEWMRYCKAKGFKVTYWFFDNEPWNHEAAYTFTLEQYAEDCAAYGTALKKEFPHVMFIANPIAGSNIDAGQIEKFVKLTGSVIDYIDIHWYWAWGKGTFQYWAQGTPLTDDDKWKKNSAIRTYGEDIQLIREACARAGRPDMGVMVLEWNVAPSDESMAFNQSLVALIQSELLLEFAKNDVRLTCLWPLLWQTSRNVWSEQDLFPSIVSSDPPFAETLSLEMFRMLGPMQGKMLLAAKSPQSDVVVLAARDQSETLFYCINKSSLRRRVNVELDQPVSGMPWGEMIGVKHQMVRPVEVEQEARSIRFFAEPYSLNAIRIVK